MAIKLTAFCGSPRKNSNSTKILQAFIRGVESGEEHGIEVESEIFRTDELNLKPCRGCLLCNNLQKCAIKGDDWNELALKIEEADILVFSTPVYFHHTTSSMKKLIDRFRSFIHVQITETGLIHTPHKNWNKKFYLFTAHGSSAIEEAGPLNELFRFMTETLGDGNSLEIINAVRLAVSGQIGFEKDRLAGIYDRLKLPSGLATEDSEKNRQYLETAERMGKLAVEEFTG